MAFSRDDFEDWMLLGEGGQGHVYRVLQKSLGRQVAVKQLKLRRAGRHEDISRFEKEARIGASLSHPALAHIHEYGSEGDFYYLVMEFIEGVPFHRLGSIPPELAWHLAARMPAILGFLHSRHVLHRDLKPENFVATAEGEVKLLDLGLAKAELGATTENENFFKGTLGYFAPELFEGPQRHSRASDLYSLALVVLELFTGRRVFEGRTVNEVIAQIRRGLALRELPAPEEIKSVLAPFLHPDAQLRSAEPSALEAALRAGAARHPAGEAHFELLLARTREFEQQVFWRDLEAREAAGRGDEVFRCLQGFLHRFPNDERARERIRIAGERLNQTSGDTEVRATGRRLRIGAMLALLAVATALGIWLTLERKGGKGRLDALVPAADPGRARIVRSHAAPATPLWGTLALSGLAEGSRVFLNGKPAGGTKANQGLFVIEAKLGKHQLAVLGGTGDTLFADSVSVSLAPETFHLPDHPYASR